MPRQSLLQSTMLAGFVGATFLSVQTAQADTLHAPNLRAVDYVNAKFEALGGEVGKKSLYGGMGSVTVPLAHSFGFQLDGVAASSDGSFVGTVGGHWFWRNPNQGLLGIYASHTHLSRYGGVGMTHVGAEAEIYWNRWTLQGVAGVEFGNGATGPSTTIGNDIVADVVDIPTRFFDRINLSYYPHDDWKVFVGHRYVGGKHALALGTEHALPMRGNLRTSLYAEGRIGEGDFKGAWAGLRVYVGQKDKPLIARHRQDDPINWEPDSLFGIVNSTSNNQLISRLPSDGGGEPE